MVCKGIIFNPQFLYFMTGIWHYNLQNQMVKVPENVRYILSWQCTALLSKSSPHYEVVQCLVLSCNKFDTEQVDTHYYYQYQRVNTPLASKFRGSIAHTGQTNCEGGDFWFQCVKDVQTVCHWEHWLLSCKFHYYRSETALKNPHACFTEEKNN